MRQTDGHTQIFVILIFIFLPFFLPNEVRSAKAPVPHKCPVICSLTSVFFFPPKKYPAETTDISSVSNLEALEWSVWAELAVWGQSDVKHDNLLYDARAVSTCVCLCVRLCPFAANVKLWHG